MAQPWMFMMMMLMEFDVCKSVHHHTIQINQPTKCNSFISLLFDVYVWLNMFRAPFRPSSRAYTALRASGFTVGEWRLERCWSWSEDGRRGARNMLSHT
jgi:hypothetical protein